MSKRNKNKTKWEWNLQKHWNPHVKRWPINFPVFSCRSQLCREAVVALCICSTGLIKFLSLESLFPRSFRDLLIFLVSWSCSLGFRGLIAFVVSWLSWSLGFHGCMPFFFCSFQVVLMVFLCMLGLMACYLSEIVFANVQLQLGIVDPAWISYGNVHCSNFSPWRQLQRLLIWPSPWMMLH